MRSIDGILANDSSVREVLLVDDDPGFVDTLTHLLRLEGYTVIAASTFDAAVQSLGASSPDVLITDIALGRSNGWGPSGMRTIAIQDCT
jgi:DNA-binding response OmpR family regulator